MNVRVIKQTLVSKCVSMCQAPSSVIVMTDTSLMLMGRAVTVIIQYKKIGKHKRVCT